MPVWHGKNDTLGDYESTAFFIRHDPTRQEFLFFGDVSPDSLCEESSKPQTISVWRAAAPKIPSTLSAIFIECSWPSGRPDEQLYGHLSPEHLVDELAALAAAVQDVRAAAAAATTVTTTAKSSHGSSTSSRVAATGDEPKRKKRRRSEPLAGLRIYVIHCKDDLERKFSRPICHVIRDQVEKLVRAKGLGVEVLSAEQGMTISMSLRSSFFSLRAFH
jgi:cAMP phosphodiesterases class-II